MTDTQALFLALMLVNVGAAGLGLHLAMLLSKAKAEIRRSSEAIEAAHVAISRLRDAKEKLREENVNFGIQVATLRDIIAQADRITEAQDQALRKCWALLDGKRDPEEAHVWTTAREALTSLGFGQGRT